MQRVLVTGAAGGIGRMLRRLMPGLYREIVWSHRRELPDRQPNELFRAIELSDMDSVLRGLEGIDGVVEVAVLGLGDAHGLGQLGGFHGLVFRPTQEFKNPFGKAF